MNQKIVVFGGTPDGLKTALMLAKSGIETRLCVCIDYGDKVIEPQKTLEVLKYSASENIVDLLRVDGCGLAIDAVHPYARDASEKICAACEGTGLEYIRLEPKNRVPDGVTEVPSAAGAAALLNKTGETALLTLNVKELEAFAKVTGYRKRLFARIPPNMENIKRCVSSGFSPEHLVCMKGPFNREMNAATINLLGVSCVVTRDSGYTAGLFEKLAAAAQTNTRLILIRTAVTDERETSFDKMCARVSEKFSVCLKLEPDGKMAVSDLKRYFPLLVSLDKKRVTVVGGTVIAYKKIEVLINYTNDLYIISNKICPELEVLVRNNKVSWLKSDFSPEFLQGSDLVVAATDDRDQNHQISEAAKAMKILVNVADSREESSFLFPVVAQNAMLAAGGYSL